MKKIIATLVLGLFALASVPASADPMVKHHHHQVVHHHVVHHRRHVMHHHAVVVVHPDGHN